MHEGERFQKQVTNMQTIIPPKEVTNRLTEEKYDRLIRKITMGEKWNPEEESPWGDPLNQRTERGETKMKTLSLEKERKEFEEEVKKTNLPEKEKTKLKSMFRTMTYGAESPSTNEYTTYEAFKGMAAIFYFLCDTQKLKKSEHDRLLSVNDAAYLKWDAYLTKYGMESPLRQFSRREPRPDKIIYNDPAMIVYWTDGLKTVVKRSENEPESKYAAFCAALAKKIYGNNSRVNRIVKGIIVSEKRAKKAKKE